MTYSVPITQSTIILYETLRVSVSLTIVLCVLVGWVESCSVFTIHPVPTVTSENSREEGSLGRLSALSARESVQILDLELKAKV